MDHVVYFCQQIIFSNTLDKSQRLAIGLVLFDNVGKFTFDSGLMCDFFQIVGNADWLMQLLKICVKIGESV